MDTAGMSDIKTEVAGEPTHGTEKDQYLAQLPSVIESAEHGHTDEGHHGDHTDRVTHISCHQINVEARVPGSVMTDSVNTCTTATDCPRVKQETVNVTQGVVPEYVVSVDSETKPLGDIKQEPDVAVARVLPVHGVSVDCGIEPHPNMKQEPSVSITLQIVPDHTDCASANCMIIPDPSIQQKLQADSVNTCTTAAWTLQVKQKAVSVTQGGVPGYVVSVDSETKPLAGIKQEPEVAVASVLPVHGVSVDCGIEPDPNMKQESSVGISSVIVPDPTDCASANCVIIPDPNSIKTDTQIHALGKPFQCTECAKSFSKSSSLKKHMRKHTVEKPYECSQCKQPFSRSDHLERHMRIHTEEKPFKCIECGKCFSRSHDLKRHMRTHQKEKPLKCIECKQSFSESGDLERHAHTHRGETT